MDRRKFIKAGGLISGSLSASALPFQADNPYQSSEKPLRDNVAIVTGAGRGIGRAISIRLAEMGAKVALIDIASQIHAVKYPLSTLDDLKSTENLIKNNGGDCIAFQADVRERLKMHEVVQSIKSEFGRADLLIANAGIADMNTLEEQMGSDVWDEIIAVNLTGTANCINAILPIMKNQEYGRIICVSSELGRKGGQNLTAYTASKWGIIGLAKSIALEVGKFNITCNVICPGPVNTGMLINDYVLSKISPSNPTYSGLNDYFKQIQPLPFGIMEPEHIAKIVGFMCSPELSYVTGAVYDSSTGLIANNMG